MAEVSNIPKSKKTNEATSSTKMVYLRLVSKSGDISTNGTDPISQACVFEGLIKKILGKPCDSKRSRTELKGGKWKQDLC